jgi:hypothetical protein
MVKKNLSEYKRKYDVARHHAWAGGILLSVMLALRILVSSIPDFIVLIIGIPLVVYILISLFFTYKYRSGLSAIPDTVRSSEELEQKKIHAEVEKERLKLEKKKAKNEAKAQKKAKK